MGAGLPTVAQEVDDLRATLLAQLQGCGNVQAARLRLKAGCTYDAPSFWHLRPRLMQAVAAEHGEAHARCSVAALDEVLRRHWPDAPLSRPAPLR